MVKIVVCTIGSKSLSVMRASVEAYCPEHQLVVFNPNPSTFGKSYNDALKEVFTRESEVIIANDDVVVTPTTMPLLLADVEELKLQHGPKLGLVAALSDDARDSQSIKHENGESVKRRRVVSPIFAWLSRAAFEVAQFPPLNWYSDDVMCEDLNQCGFVHYISRSYVHHVGSQTVGRDYTKLNNEALPWLRANRPEYVTKWWGKQWL